MDEVPVLLSDLENLKATLTAAQQQNEAWDIFDSYRKLNNRFQWSALTRQLNESVTKIEAYIESAQEEDDGEG